MINLASMFLGPTGKGSMNRVLVAVVVLSIMSTWTLVSIKKVEMQPMSPEQIAIVLGALGIQVAHKAQEKRIGSTTQVAQGTK
jgi:hypothetical protein